MAEEKPYKWVYKEKLNWIKSENEKRRTCSACGDQWSGCKNAVSGGAFARIMGLPNVGMAGVEVKPVWGKMIRTFVKKWWSQKKTYPNGSTFTRGEILTFNFGCLLALIGALWVFVALMGWLLDDLVEGWKWNSTHSHNEVMQKNIDFLHGIGGWLILSLATAIVGLTILIKRVSKRENH